MGVINGATHMNFAGVGFGARRVDLLVTQTIAEFLKSVRLGHCVLPKSTNEIALQSK
jgi:hypothetical protein